MGIGERSQAGIYDTTSVFADSRTSKDDADWYNNTVTSSNQLNIDDDTIINIGEDSITGKELGDFLKYRKLIMRLLYDNYPEEFI